MTQISPILLYGSKIWGAYLDYDYQVWEKSETEKVLTQFLKRILGCAIQTPNLMVRSEVGIRPLLCSIIKRSILYIKSFDHVNDILANQALEIEIDLEDEKNFLSLVMKIYTILSRTEQLLGTNK